MKFNIYHIGTALSGNIPALKTSYCVQMALLLNHCGCQIFTPRAEILKQASAGAEYQWLLFYTLFGPLTAFLSLAFAISTSKQNTVWIVFYFFMTGPMNCSPAENACFSVNILTCERVCP